MPAWDNQPRLDRQVALQGTFQNGVTTWSLPYRSTSVTQVVLAHSAFGSDHGKVLEVTNSGGLFLVINGDYSAGCVIEGEPAPLVDLEHNEIECEVPNCDEVAQVWVVGDDGKSYAVCAGCQKGGQA